MKLSSILSFFLWLWGVIRPNSDRELGRVEEANKEQSKTIKNVELSNEVRESVDALHDGDASGVLKSKYGRK